jgi:hemin uptake protein HemP
MQTAMALGSNTTETSRSWSRRKRTATAGLMQGACEVIIVHGGEEYLRRITKTGKLILTK